jgi:hypothetical protein
MMNDRFLRINRIDSRPKDRFGISAKFTKRSVLSHAATSC